MRSIIDYELCQHETPTANRFQLRFPDATVSRYAGSPPSHTLKVLFGGPIVVSLSAYQVHVFDPC
jgi:hypothetical protein